MSTRCIIESLRGEVYQEPRDMQTHVTLLDPHAKQRYYFKFDYVRNVNVAVELARAKLASEWIGN